MLVLCYCVTGMFSVNGAQFTCDDVDVRVRVFTQLHGVAVPLERLA